MQSVTEGRSRRLHVLAYCTGHYITLHYITPRDAHQSRNHVTLVVLKNVSDYFLLLLFLLISIYLTEIKMTNEEPLPKKVSELK